MKLVIFGATGHLGKFVLEEALNAGHQVSVLVRHPEKLLPQKNLEIIHGDALSINDVLQIIKGKEAVISVISEGPEIINNTQSVAVGNMIKAMQQTGVKRIICMGANGILQFNKHELIRDRPNYPKLYLALSYEHSAVNQQLHATHLDWTQVCPPTIIAAPSDGKYLVKADYLPSKNMEANAGNIGAFMMKELNENNFLSKRVGITNV